jgi:hypothetical protein
MICVGIALLHTRGEYNNLEAHKDGKYLLGEAAVNHLQV